MRSHSRWRTCAADLHPVHTDAVQARERRSGRLPCSQAASTVSRSVVLRRLGLAATAIVPVLTTCTADAEVQLPSAARLFQAEERGAVVPVNPSFVLLLLRTVTQVVDAATLRGELDKLLRQEWPYYAPSNGLALEPALVASDVLGESVSTRLTDPAVLNFALYCLFKVIARHVPDEASREQLSQRLGNRLLTAVCPEAEAAVRGKSDGDEQLLRGAVQMLLDAFVRGGYMRSYTIAWGALPSLPSVPGGVNADSSTIADDGLFAGRCQIRLNAPADLPGGVALRAEESGWWSRLVPVALLALLSASGRTGARIDDAYFQDTWKGPTKLLDKIVLALGDPLFTVDVPFTPDTLALDLVY